MKSLISCPLVLIAFLFSSGVAQACGFATEHIRLECLGEHEQTLLTSEWFFDSRDATPFVSSPFKWGSTVLGKLLWNGSDLREIEDDFESQANASDEEWVLMMFGTLRDGQRRYFKEGVAKDGKHDLNLLRFSNLSKRTKVWSYGEDSEWHSSSVGEFSLHLELWSRPFELKCRLSNYHSSEE